VDTPDELLARFNRRPSAGEVAILELERESRLALPAEYLDFLRRSNGGEGFVGDAYVILWRAEEIVEWNSRYEVAKYAQGLFLFGSDGGGEAFAFDTRSESWPIVMVPFIGMELKVALPIARSFAGFFAALATS
jgi:hypothetical protein